MSELPPRPPMIVCHCTGFTDRDVRELARRGARTCEEIASRCSAGAGCGGCRPLLAELLAGCGQHARQTEPRARAANPTNSAP